MRIRPAWIVLQVLLSNTIFLSTSPVSAGRTDTQEQSRPASSSDFTIKTRTVLVTVDAVVRNDKGGFVGNLQADDFVVYDNGVEQQISMFSRDELPLAVAFVLDRSPSVQPYLPQLRAAALAALERLKPEDQVALFSFDMNVAQFSELTGDRRAIAQMIGRIPSGVGTNIYDALYDAAQYLREKAPDRRRAIVLVSDNYQSVPSSQNIKETLQEMLEAGTILYSIRTRGDNPNMAGPGDPSVIARFARETGGEVLSAESATKVPEALDAVISNLKQGYTLGFAPSNVGEEGSYHRLDVKLSAGGNCPTCKVQARSAYYAGTHAPAPPINKPRGNPKLPQPPRQIYDPEESIAQTRIMSARVSGYELSDIEFEIATNTLSDAQGKRQIQVDLRIDPAQVLFRTVNGLHTGRLRITVFYQNAAGKILSSDWKIMDMRLKEETYQRILQSGIPYSTTVPLSSPKQILKVVVYDPWSYNIGSRSVHLQ